MNANDRPVEPSGPDRRLSRRGFLAGAAGLSAGAMVGRQPGVAHAEVGGSGLHGRPPSSESHGGAHSSSRLAPMTPTQASQ
jgi:hypothetical protein